MNATEIIPVAAKCRTRFVGTMALLCLLTFPLGTVAGSGAIDAAECSFKGKPLYGKIQIVDAFPDIRVQIVTAFPDLKVQRVSAFPDRCGKWQLVTAFPDTKVQFVDSFPDIKVQFVDAFPGLR